jgi:predicted adenylyl cyclase CyaB
MPDEFEVKVFSIDLLAIQKKLKKIGKFDRQVTIHDYLFQNAFTKDNGIVVRLRTTKTECILTFKGPYEGTPGRQSREEIELAIPSLESGQSLLRLAGFTQASQRTLDRQYYTVDSVSVEIICTSLYPPYLEVEGDHDTVIRVCEGLGIADSDIMVGEHAYLRPESND